jgi:hypothetical protein
VAGDGHAPPGSVQSPPRRSVPVLGHSNGRYAGRLRYNQSPRPDGQRCSRGRPRSAMVCTIAAAPERARPRAQQRATRRTPPFYPQPSTGRTTLWPGTATLRHGLCNRRRAGACPSSGTATGEAPDASVITRALDRTDNAVAGDGHAPTGSSRDRGIRNGQRSGGPHFSSFYAVPAT